MRRALDGEAPLVELVAAEPQLGEAGAALLEPSVASRRTTPGGAGPPLVTQQLARFREQLAADAARLAAADDGAPPSGATASWRHAQPS